MLKRLSWRIVSLPKNTRGYRARQCQIRCRLKEITRGREMIRGREGRDSGWRITEWRELRRLGEREGKKDAKGGTGRGHTDSRKRSTAASRGRLDSMHDRHTAVSLAREEWRHLAVTGHGETVRPNNSSFSPHASCYNRWCFMVRVTVIRHHVQLTAQVSRRRSDALCSHLGATWVT